MKPPRNPVPRITLRDLAQKAGVHYSTVSLALHNDPRLLPETREKVQRVAKEMGYRPDPMLASLSAYRLTKSAQHYKATLGWINNWPDRGALLKNKGFKEYYEGACMRAEELGYSIEEFWLQEKGMTAARLYRILKARGIDGLLMPPQHISLVPPPIDFSNYSAVAFGYSMQPSVLHVVTNNHFRSINLIMAHLFELGYRRIGTIIEADWDAKVCNAWTAGFLLAEKHYPGMKVFSRLLDSDLKINMEGLIEEHRFDAVVALADYYEDLCRLGYDIPGKLGFVNLHLNKDDRELSGIYHNDLLIGKKAVDVLVGMLHRGERGEPEIPISTLVEGEWRPGKTLRQLEPPLAQNP